VGDGVQNSTWTGDGRGDVGENLGDPPRPVDVARRREHGDHRPSENGSHRHPRAGHRVKPEFGSEVHDGTERSEQVSIDGRCLRVSIGCALRSVSRPRALGLGGRHEMSVASATGPGGEVGGPPTWDPEELNGSPNGYSGSRRVRPRCRGWAALAPLGQGIQGSQVGVIDMATARCVPSGRPVTAITSAATSGPPARRKRGGKSLVTTISADEGSAHLHPLGHDASVAPIFSFVSTCHRRIAHAIRSMSFDLQEPTP
jgi:hypothetical protein